MGGAAFPTKKATSPAPSTVWFAAIPDRLTMAWGGRGALNSSTQGIPAFYANQWNLTAATLGGFITAPDGTTNTMQLIVEDTSNGGHGIFAQQAQGFSTNNISPTSRFRLSGFFKAGTRTRVALYFANGNARGNQPGSFMYTVFDLAGGQIGVAPTVTNTAGGVLITSFGAEMVAFGNGVYRCSMDFNLVFNQTGSTGWQPIVFIDKGSGTGAANFSYTGDGASGIYGWKMSIMPSAAWGINNTPMFDDFTSLSTIDVNNTGAPGFNWYPRVSWPGFTTGGGMDMLEPFSTPASSFTVNGSVLTIAPAGILGGLEYSMASAQSTYPVLPGAVGTGWTLPVLFEIKMAYNVYQSPGPYQFSPGAAIYWTLPLEFLANAHSNPRPFGNISREVDMAEFEGTAGVFQATQHYYQPAPTPSTIPFEVTLPSGNANDGVSLWSSQIFYTAAPTITVVDPFDSNRYHSLISSNQGNSPHASPAAWAAGGLAGTAPGSFDASQFHTYSTLILPLFNSTPLGPNSLDYVGSTYHFFDGGCVCIGASYPLSQEIRNSFLSIFTQQSANYLQTADGFHFIFIIGTDQNLPLQIDFARVMQ